MTYLYVVIAVVVGLVAAFGTGYAVRGFVHRHLLHVAKVLQVRVAQGDAAAKAELTKIYQRLLRIF